MKEEKTLDNGSLTHDPSQLPRKTKLLEHQSHGALTVLDNDTLTHVDTSMAL